jgi:hypothetical protein
MSDPKDKAALTPTDVEHIVEVAGTHSLISASVMSSRVITEASAYFERSAAALEQIQTVLQGKGPDGAANPMAVTAALDPASVQSIADTLKQAIQPQLDKHGTALEALRTQLGEAAQRSAENERTIAAVLLGDEGHIRRLDLEIAALVARLIVCEGWRGGDAPSRGAATAATDDREAQALREAHDVLRDRVVNLESAVRRLVEHGTSGGGTRPTSPTRPPRGGRQ